MPIARLFCDSFPDMTSTVLETSIKMNETNPNIRSTGERKRERRVLQNYFQAIPLTSDSAAWVSTIHEHVFGQENKDLIFRKIK